MSFYRTFIAAVAAMGLATAVFAADEATTTTTDSTTTTQSATNETPSTDKINVNTASAKELMKVKGLNASKAKAIVSYRKKHGDFKSLDDLKMVKGFKKMNDDNMKAIADQLTVG